MKCQASILVASLVKQYFQDVVFFYFAKLHAYEHPYCKIRIVLHLNTMHTFFSRCEKRIKYTNSIRVFARVCAVQNKK